MDQYRSAGYAQVTTTTPAFALAAAPGPADGSNQQPRGVLLQAEGANIRYRTDGQAPTSTVGFLMYSGADPLLFTGDLSQLRFIQAASGAILNVGWVI